MKWYLSIVRIFSVVSILISLVMIGYESRRIISPDSTLSSTLDQDHKTIQRILKDWPKDQPFPDTEKIISHDEEKHEEGLEQEQKKGFARLKKAFLFLGLGIVVFLSLGKIRTRDLGRSHG